MSSALTKVFIHALQTAAVPAATVHPIMTFTHNLKTYFDADIYDSIPNINTAQEVIIRKREKDGVLAFWYKPDSSHKTLYPTAKDKAGKPIEVTLNGEKAYTHCEYGIIFRTGCVAQLPPLLLSL
eukprot:6209613-Pleurochrysis_carterae.AAC.1